MRERGKIREGVAQVETRGGKDDGEGERIGEGKVGVERTR